MAIDIGERPDQVRAYVTRHGLTFPHLLDANYEVSPIFGVRGTPTSFLIDRKGRVRGGGVGYRDWSSPEAQKLVESLLTEVSDASPDS